MGQPNKAKERERLVREIRLCDVPKPNDDVSEVLVLNRKIISSNQAIVTGSTAFSVYCAQQGLHTLPVECSATNDVDVACVRPRAAVSAVPPPMTSLNAATRLFLGGKASLDFMTPKQEGEKEPFAATTLSGGHIVWLRCLDTYAYAMPRKLEFLLKNPVVGVLPCADGIGARIPDPARYAVFKLEISEARRAEEKILKDRGQAIVLLEQLLFKGEDKINSLLVEMISYEGAASIGRIRSALEKSESDSQFFNRWKRKILGVYSHNPS